MIYLAQDDPTMLTDYLGMNKEDIDRLVSALVDMELVKCFYTDKIVVTHPETKARGKNKKQLEERAGRHFRVVPKKEKSIAAIKMEDNKKSALDMNEANNKL